MPFKSGQYQYVEFIENPERGKIRDAITNFVPAELVKKLDAYIIKQDIPKKKLATEVMLHKLRNSVRFKTDSRNVLMIGASGSGKTATMRALSTALGEIIPMVDISGVTSAGYVGLSVESVIKAAVYKLGDALPPTTSPTSIKELFQQSIIYIDEIDKIKQTSDYSDILGHRVQIELLKYLDEQEVIFEKPPYRDFDTISTRNMLFVCGGAFSGLDEVIKKRLKTGTAIGFGAQHRSEIDDKQILQQVTVEDLINYGFLPEFIGRFSSIVVFDTLEVDEFVKILKESKDSILEQHVNICTALDIKVDVQDEALRIVAEKALKLKTGARSLKLLINTIFQNYYENMEQHTGKTITIDKETVEKLLA